MSLIKNKNKINQSNCDELCAQVCFYFKEKQALGSYDQLTGGNITKIRQ